MKIIWIAFFSLSLIFISCQAPTDPKKRGNMPDPLDISSQDRSVRPQSNFYLFANGDWIKKTPIPDAESRWGLGDLVQVEIYDRLKKINEEQVKFRNEKLTFINVELAKLDTLTTVYNRYLASSKITTTYYINEADPSKIYKQATDLIDEKGIILNWLSSSSDDVGSSMMRMSGGWISTRAKASRCCSPAPMALVWACRRQPV
jgi:hypothetical protein